MKLQFKKKPYGLLVSIRRYISIQLIFYRLVNALNEGSTSQILCFASQGITSILCDLLSTDCDKDLIMTGFESLLEVGRLISETILECIRSEIADFGGLKKIITLKVKDRQMQVKINRILAVYFDYPIVDTGIATTIGEIYDEARG